MASRQPRRPIRDFRFEWIQIHPGGMPAISRGSSEAIPPEFDQHSDDPGRGHSRTAMEPVGAQITSATPLGSRKWFGRVPGVSLRSTPGKSVFQIAGAWNPRGSGFRHPTPVLRYSEEPDRASKNPALRSYLRTGVISKHSSHAIVVFNLGDHLTTRHAPDLATWYNWASVSGDPIRNRTWRSSHTKLWAPAPM